MELNSAAGGAATSESRGGEWEEGREQDGEPVEALGMQLHEMRCDEVGEEGEEEEENGEEAEALENGDTEALELAAQLQDLEAAPDERCELPPALPPKRVPLPSGAKFRRTRKLHAMMLCKYDEVWNQADALGWRPEDGLVDAASDPPADWNICWSDTSVALERIMKMSRLQKINHFPGMLELVRKAGTARNLNKMLQAVGKEYKFFPKTFQLPADYTALKAEFGGARRGNKTFIVKPSKGCQGKDIMLTRSLDEIDPHEPNIVQRYMHKPHLLGGYKYDLRLYVLLTSVNPMRIYLFREGLVRVCTQKYCPKYTPSNLRQACMHLTNYAINKESEAFVQAESAEDEGAHKRTVSNLMNTLRSEGHDVETLWRLIGELCVKTLISVQPHLEHTYYSCHTRSNDPGFGCFELLGFDVIIDHKMRPFLLEVNHSPSFACDSPLDAAVKSAVIRGTMELISFSREEYKVLRRMGSRMDSALRAKLHELRSEYERVQKDRHNFDQIFPPNLGDADADAELTEQYEYFLAVAAELYAGQSMMGSRRKTTNCGSLAATSSRGVPGGRAAPAASSAR